MQLRIETRVVDGVTVVRCSGKLVFGDESAALRERVKELLGVTKAIVVNLGETTYIDSGGLGTLVGLYTSARHANAVIRLSNLQQRIMDLLQVTKLLTVFEVYSSEEQAIHAFKLGATA